MNIEKLIVKKEILDTYRPFPKPLIQNLDEWFAVELTYTSNAIEGNTLTRAETALVVEKGLTIGGKSLREHFEVNNHIHALEWVKSLVNNKISHINEKTIIEIQRLILNSIDDTHAGSYRNIPVRISGSPVILPNPLKVGTLMSEFIEWLQTADVHPVEKAFMGHYKLVSIHPFVDGNGRTARLLMNLILMMAGYPPAIIRPEDRLAYIKSLEKAQMGGSLDVYLTLMTKAVDRSLEIYIKALRGESATQTETTTELLKIGKLSSLSDTPLATLRFWTHEGLLNIATTTPSGYWLFTPETIDRIEIIKNLQNQRLTLKEIKQKLENQ